MQYAAHQLDKDAKQWENNSMVEAARKMAQLMKQMAKFTRYGHVTSRSFCVCTNWIIMSHLNVMN